MELRTHSTIIDYLVEYNRKQSELFCEPSEVLWRKQYRKRRGMHRTRFSTCECMDGRVHMERSVGVPSGIFNSYRTVGGKFEIGEPYFKSRIMKDVQEAIKKGANRIFFVTYHFSRSNPEEWGCAGFKCNIEAAIAYTKRLKNSIETAFGPSHSVVYPIQVGIETDEDALVFHGENGSTLDLGEETDLGSAEIILLIKEMFLDASKSIANTLLEITQGNQYHVHEVRASGRSASALNHKERVFGFGEGFDWHHKPNDAIFVGPYNIDLREPIIVGANLLLKNLKGKRIDPDEGIVLMTSATYANESDPGKSMAIFESRHLMCYALEIIKKEVGELIKHLAILPVILNTETRLFTRITP